ncbi:HlyD family secretion protein [Lutimonas zeaxanthinifaciens]|uniref:HlyD family secretion protein n=1 Tax=Lutimonas zeaxanthinifaciens TaxID=3060215 RepID=UPI00265CED5B|nr:HlyD family secretion protein [Lutimonas sp. YSD2104]WKK65634.1 HlyD family secretion protein [Lutimonas sp. YSD2104]
MGKEKKSIKKVSLIVLIVTAMFFIWYVSADRHTPYTDQARIQGLITPVSPRVSGFVTEINIKLHSRVKAGDVLFQLDKRPFEIAIDMAEAEIDNTTQSVAASGASVKSSAGKLGVAKAQLDRAQRNWDRVQKVMRENEGALSEADKDQAETALLQATEQVASAEASLERAEQSLGVSGPDNPKIRRAVQKLEKAQLDLEFSTITAPTDGVIESFDVDLGYYANAGQPITTLISSSDVWIQANLKENNLSKMNLEDEVEFSLDIAPGTIFKGKVRSIGFGVATDQTNKGGLPSVSDKKGWLQDPQRFPVIISCDDPEVKDLYRLGGQVDVVVYTGDNFLLNAIAGFRLRLISFLSYVR